MTISYLQILKTCDKCGEHYSLGQEAECPHKFINPVTQAILEGGWKNMDELLDKRDATNREVK